MPLPLYAYSSCPLTHRFGVDRKALGIGLNMLLHQYFSLAYQFRATMECSFTSARPCASLCIRSVPFSFTCVSQLPLAFVSTAAWLLPSNPSEKHQSLDGIRTSFGLQFADHTRSTSSFVHVEPLSLIGH
eukprot:4478848-Pleurochrysis_carterae.AAC.1